MSTMKTKHRKKNNALIFDFGQEKLNQLTSSQYDSSRWTWFNGNDYGSVSEQEMVEELIKHNKLDKVPFLAEKYSRHAHAIQTKQNSSLFPTHLKQNVSEKATKRKLRNSSVEECKSKGKKVISTKPEEELQTNHCCPSCNFRYRTKASLLKHCSKFHRENNICKICKSTFSNKYNLARHLRTVHQKAIS